MGSKQLNSVVTCGILSTYVVVEVKRSMARAKKNGTYLNVCIETSIYKRLENLCVDAGQTKTVAVERALIAYLDAYEEKQKRLKELDSVK